MINVNTKLHSNCPPTRHCPPEIVAKCSMKALTVH